MNTGFFITGTDTGVGKTVVAGAFIRAIEMLGVRACGMKPVESGCRRQGDVLVPPDGVFLKNIARMDENVDEIAPYAFEAPLAPMVAAEMEGVEIDYRVIKKAFNSLLKKYGAVVAEGAGGLLVPIREDFSVLDMARSFELPLVVVARPSLGTLNHTLLTVKHALSEGLQVAGVVINYANPPEGTLAEQSNPEAMKRLSPVPLIGVFPYLDDMSMEGIDRAVVKNLELGLIKKFLPRI